MRGSYKSEGMREFLLNLTIAEEIVVALQAHGISVTKRAFPSSLGKKGFIPVSGYACVC